MDDHVREALATLGQRIEVADYERRLAVEEVRALMARHHAGLQLAWVSELTTLPQPTLEAMIDPD